MATICVFTTEGLLFEVQGATWVSERIRSDGGHTQVITKVYGKVVMTTPQDVVAEFTDVHAVWFKDKGELIKPDPDDEE